MSLPSCHLFFIANVVLFWSETFIQAILWPPNDTPHSHVLPAQTKIKKTSSKFFEFAVLAGHSCFSRTNLIQGEGPIERLAKFCRPYGILLPKLFWPTVRKNCSNDWEKLLKFRAEGWDFAQVLRSQEKLI